MASRSILEDLYNLRWTYLLLTVTIFTCDVVFAQRQQSNRQNQFQGVNRCSRQRTLPFTSQRDQQAQPQPQQTSVNQCCPGWTTQPGQKDCIVPVCPRGCGSGRCVGPNLCYCPGGTMAETCDAVSCQGGCANNGRCLGNNRCQCAQGFTGQNCQTDSRTGPCYSQIVSNICKGQLIGVVCTKAVCCATIGQAWGQPCQRCQPTPHPCRRGYILNREKKQCVDIDECIAIPGLCVGGQCYNTLGSYRCECPSNTRKNPITGACEGRVRCRSSPGVCENGMCHDNAADGYFCTCSSGYVASADKQSCVVSRRGSCYRSLVGSRCSSPIGQFVTLRECCCSYELVAWGDACQVCPGRNTGQFGVLCQSGSNLTRDVDECRLFPNMCPNGQCINTVGSFECRCSQGYQVDPQGQCRDIDECGGRARSCRGGRCKNTPGGFTCECPPGRVPSKDKSYCTDMNECATTNMCPNGRCENMEGSYKCRCEPGFQSSENGQICLDLDECRTVRGVCRNGRCLNMVGGFRCRCRDGFELSQDGKACYDIDECSNAPGGVCRNGQCLNMEGTFRCICKTGYQLSEDGRNCEDIDECRTEREICDNGRCYNSIGSFRCDCYDGFYITSDGRACKDTRRGYCFMNVEGGQCQNPASSLITRSACCCAMGMGEAKGVGWGGLDCKTCPGKESEEYKRLCTHGGGMDGNGDDIDECRIMPGICPNGVCENLEKGYRCRCNTGFVVDETQKTCNDIDECRTVGDLCRYGTCRNTDGSFECQCPDGTRYDKRTKICTDIDECVEKKVDGLCYGGQCINEQGSYKCECTEEGAQYDPVKKICIDRRESACWSSDKIPCEGQVAKKMTRENCCSTFGKAWGTPCKPCPANRVCDKGYQGHRPEDCRDVDECRLFGSELCDGGDCRNTEGSFRCTCPRGFRLNADGTKCVDHRISSCYARSVRGRCDAQFGGRYTRKVCCCSVGRGWGSPCEECPAKSSDEFKTLCADVPNIDECSYFPSLCKNGRCVNEAGGFTCECGQGFALDDSGLNCTDIDECRIAESVCGNGTCFNTPGRFRCNCQPGFESTMAMQACMDIDECARTPTLCRGGRCVNTAGSFRCLCTPGHEMSADGRSCQDINECSTMSGVCSNGQCVNFKGGYQCFCETGFKPNPQKTACMDIDECAVERGGCSHECKNIPGSFQCLCNQGYKLSSDQRRCVDQDECSVTPEICNGGDCINMEGSYRCRCKAGTTPARDGKSCKDVDECSAETRKVCGNGACKNTQGSYVCECQRGFSVKRIAPARGCTDDDECAQRTSDCDRNAECRNTLGAFTCTCKKGFEGDGKQCIDINECLDRNGGCDKDASCNNLPGTFTCTCDKGYTGDGFSCIDTDECGTNPRVCDHGRCINYQGGYRCECEMGYTPKQGDKACEDIDECVLFPHLCVNGRCENGPGKFRCKCNPGYKLDASGGNCTDVDECENADNCRYGTCGNEDGTYKCQCPANHDLNPAGTGCVDKRLGFCYREDAVEVDRCQDILAYRIQRSTCCCTVGTSWGEQERLCDYCPRNGSFEFDTLCAGGYGFKPNTLTVVLEDIDECREIPNICRGGKCENTFGSFRCSCEEGYTYVDWKSGCKDIDECATGSSRCGTGRCINLDGSYRCQCPRGYILMGSGKECMDIRTGMCYKQFSAIDESRGDAAIGSRGQCLQAMPAELTKMVCCCSMGRAWGESCEKCPEETSDESALMCGDVGPGMIIDPNTGEPTDLDECSKIAGICENGECINTEGSFLCQCQRGFQLNHDKSACVDIDECLLQRSSCIGRAKCENLPGTFRCTCPDGYRLTENRKSCIDIDECEQVEKVCDHGSCLNLIGTFNCLCMKGYQPSLNRDSCIDIDECRSQLGICGNGTCANNDGSYTCSCMKGYTKQADGYCLDEDECRKNPNNCRNGRCVNTMGAFVCQCQPGFDPSPDGADCLDRDECDKEGICPNGKCENSMGAFKCECEEGYEVDDTKEACKDKDECTDESNMCGTGRCVNSEGGFRCFCEPGFQLSENGKMCIDNRKGQCYTTLEDNECANARKEPTNMADCCCTRGVGWTLNDEACQMCPNQGTEEFQKLCPDGMGYKVGPNGEIEDIDECELYKEICENGQCVNTDGSYRCQCYNGFKPLPSGNKCVDQDECARSNPCGNGTCSNLPGSYKCNCRKGFYQGGDDNTCKDTNECDDTTLNKCAFRCQNVRGSFRCLCPRGYVLAADGLHCEDLDECATGQHECRYACKNLVGMHMCICNPGYRQVGNDECIDVDECRDNPLRCRNGRCVNTVGGFVCDCYRGYQPNKESKKCIDVREDFCYLEAPGGVCYNPAHRDRPLQRMTKTECCCNVADAWSAMCERCPVEGAQEYEELCADHVIGTKPDGTDIDECRRKPDICKHGRCANVIGSYRCLCENGYKVDESGTQCIDLNECTETERCQQECENSEGSFTCSCRKGFRLNPDKRTCRDVDECELKQDNCDGECINTDGGFKCGCQKGYKTEGDDCKDVDECSNASENTCAPHGQCTNMVGSFVCRCDRGYKPTLDGKKCVDKDTKLVGPDGNIIDPDCQGPNCPIKCQGPNCPDGLNRCPGGNCNLCPGGRCGQCPPGFVNYRGGQCIDENECMTSGICGQGNCVNTAGNYACGCGSSGQRFDPSNLACVGGSGGTSGGGNACDVNPCNFGCQQQGQGGFSCQCPNGYTPIGQGHCITTVDAPVTGLLPQGNSNYPSNSNLPHVFAPEGSSGLPTGEGCYECDLGESETEKRSRTDTGSQNERTDQRPQRPDNSYGAGPEPSHGEGSLYPLRHESRGGDITNRRSGSESDRPGLESEPHRISQVQADSQISSLYEKMQAYREAYDRLRQEHDRAQRDRTQSDSGAQVVPQRPVLHTPQRPLVHTPQRPLVHTPQRPLVHNTPQRPVQRVVPMTPRVIERTAPHRDASHQPQYRTHDGLPRSVYIGPEYQGQGYEQIRPVAISPLNVHTQNEQVEHQTGTVAEATGQADAAQIFYVNQRRKRSVHQKVTTTPPLRALVSNDTSAPGGKPLHVKPTPLTVHVLINETESNSTIVSLLPAFRTLNTTVDYRLLSKDAPAGLFELELSELGQLLVQVIRPVKKTALYHISIVGRPVSTTVKNFAGVNLVVQMRIYFI